MDVDKVFDSWLELAREAGDRTLPKFPFLNLWVKDILGDHNCISMGAEEFGAYVSLLLVAWQTELPGTLPNDQAQLPALARMSPRRWRECGPKVLQCWQSCRAGRRIAQKRLVEEYEKALSRYMAKKRAGRLGAERRWRPDGNANGCAIAEPLPNGWQSGSGFSALEGVGGLGEGETFSPPPAVRPPTAQDLAAEWCFRLTHHVNGYPRDKLPDAALFFAEMVRLGQSSEAIMEEIQRAERDRNETLWQLQGRLRGVATAATAAGVDRCQSRPPPVAGGAMGSGASRLREPGKRYPAPLKVCSRRDWSLASSLRRRFEIVTSTVLVIAKGS